MTSSSRKAPPFQSYKRLNTAQRKAADAIEGPVMVIAGPGTGKTEVVALRVANILHKTQMRPSNILCLTFSTSGAKTMRERLRQIIGFDAYGVTVETVHSFCNEIIQRHPHVFEDFRALEQVSEIERLRVVRELMKGLGPGSVLGRPSTESGLSPASGFRGASRASAILSRISEMKREGISVEALRELVPRYRSEIETTDKGKERSKETLVYRNDLRSVQQFEEFIRIYHGYNDALRESHRYDYEDMVLVAIDALKCHDWLLAGLQERYQYVLVDEFQDLNGAQSRVIEILTSEPLSGHEPNLFVVGDDDQAIYRFQGASPANMLRFLERFPKAPVVTLTENYRSTQAILDAASAVIENNRERLAEKVPNVTKKLTAQNEQRPVRQAHGKRTKNEIPAFLRFPAIENERAGIVEILKNARDGGTPWTEMAILCRRNEELGPLFDTLLSAGIPTILTAKQDLLLHPKVLELIVILRAIEHINSDAALSAALGCETFGIHPADLGRLWMKLRRKNQRRKSNEPHTTLRESLLYADTDPVFQYSSISVFPAFSLIEKLHAQKESLTLPDLVERALRETGLLPTPGGRRDVARNIPADTETKSKDEPPDPCVIAGLQEFHRYVKDRVHEYKALTLPQLLLDLDQYLTERHLKLEYAVPHLVSDGVSLMTAHGAKGLEFALVILAHVRYRNWGDSARGSLLSLPDHLIFNIDRNIERNTKQEDERRLFFVAMTRAKERLLLTFSEMYPSGDEVRDAEPSSFVAEAGELLNEVVFPPDKIPSPIETFRKPDIPRDEVFRVFMEERLKDFALSASALNAFLEDPRSFLWAHLLQMPQPAPPHFAYGSAVHAALEKYHLEKGDIDLIRTFEEIMEQREVFTKAEREHYLHVGRIVLERYAKEVANDHPIVYATERSLYARMPSGKTNDDAIPLIGIIDRIDLFKAEGQNCRIVDYKTGKPRKTVKSVQKDSALYRQLVFYKLLSDLSPSFTHTATLFTLDFVGDEKEGRRVLDFEIPDSEVQELRELITLVWEKIVALDFTPL